MFSEKALQETIDYIYENTGYSEEKKEKIKTYLLGDNPKSFIIKNLNIFVSTPLIDEILEKDEFISLIINLMFEYLTPHEDYMFKIIFVENIDKIYKNDKFINAISKLNDEQLFKLINTSCINKIEINNNLLSRIEKYFFKEINEENKNLFYRFPKFPKSIQDKILNDDTLCNKFMDIFLSDLSTNLYIHSLNEETILFLYNKYFDKLNNLSLNDKINFVTSKYENIRKKALKDFNIVAQLSDLTKVKNLERLLETLGKENIISIAINTQSSSIFSKCMKFLNAEEQLNILKNPNCFFNKIVNTINELTIISSLKPENVEYIFKIFKNQIYNYQLSKYFEILKLNECIETIKERILSETNFSNISIFLKTKEIRELFTDTEIKQIFSIVDMEKDSLSVQNLMIYIIKENPNDSYLKYIYDLLRIYLKNNDSIRGFYEFTDIMNNIPNDLFILYMKKLPKDTIINSIFKDEVFNKLMEYLKTNPDYFNGIINDHSKAFYDYSSKINMHEKIDKLLYYLPKENYKILFTRGIIEKNEKVKKLYAESLRKNPNILDLELIDFIDEELLIKSIKDISIINILDDYNLNEFIKNKKYFSIISEKVNSSSKEIIEYINKNYSTSFYSRLKIFLNEDSILLYINSITNNKYDFYKSIKNMINPELSKKLFIKMINEDEQIELSDLNQEDLKLFLEYADMSTLINHIQKGTLKIVENTFINKIKENPQILLSESCVSNLKNIIYKFDEKTRIFIEQCIEIIYSSKKYKNELDNCKSIDVFDKLKYIYLKDNNILNEEKYNKIQELIKRNPFVLKTINVNIFEDYIYNMGNHFIEKTSIHEKIILDIIEIIKKNPQLKELFSAISNHLINNNESEIAYDTKIERIISWLNFNSLDCDLNNLSDSKLEDIINYILYHDNKFTRKYLVLESIHDFSIDNFSEERIKVADNLLKEETSLMKAKNLFFSKYLSIGIEDIITFKKMYLDYYDKVKQYAENNLPEKYIEIIEKVLDIENLDVLKELYYKMNKIYTISDYITIENIVKKAYIKSLSNDYKNKQNGTKITKEFVFSDGTSYKIEIEELIDNFNLLVHSTDAYGSMLLINDSYFESWNYNPGTENHGVCASMISNSSYGTAPVNGNGVMFGFTRLNENSLATYSPYDLVTVNNGYNIQSLHTPYYLPLEEVSNYTRHTHNEFTLERRNSTLDNRYPCIQPDCIIIFEDMDESIKQNSINAYNDFKAHGIELKLIYIDRVKVATNEAEKLKAMISEYNNTYDLNLLKEIINKYESNICSCDFIGTGKKESLNLFNQDELFMTQEMKNILNNTIDYLSNENNIELTNKFIDIMEQEQYKFNLLNDVKTRSHKFTLYDENIKERIKNLENITNIASIRKAV